jgi:hypothetical protein
MKFSYYAFTIVILVSLIKQGLCIKRLKSQRGIPGTLSKTGLNVFNIMVNVFKNQWNKTPIISHLISEIPNNRINNLRQILSPNDRSYCNRARKYMYDSYLSKNHWLSSKEFSKDGFTQGELDHFDSLVDEVIELNKVIDNLNAEKATDKII